MTSFPLGKTNEIRRFGFGIDGEHRFYRSVLGLRAYTAGRYNEAESGIDGIAQLPGNQVLVVIEDFSPLNLESAFCQKLFQKRSVRITDHAALHLKTGWKNAGPPSDSRFDFDPYLLGSFHDRRYFSVDQSDHAENPIRMNSGVLTQDHSRKLGNTGQEFFFFPEKVLSPQNAPQNIQSQMVFADIDNQDFVALYIENFGYNLRDACQIGSLKYYVGKPKLSFFKEINFQKSAPFRKRYPVSYP